MGSNPPRSRIVDIAQYLKALRLPTRTRYILDICLVKIFVADPDGLMTELKFPKVDTNPPWAAASEA